MCTKVNTECVNDSRKTTSRGLGLYSSSSSCYCTQQNEQKFTKVNTEHFYTVRVRYFSHNVRTVRDGTRTLFRKGTYGRSLVFGLE